MLQKYLAQLADGLSQERTEDGTGESVASEVDGLSYALDLSESHAGEFRTLLEPYVSAARKAKRAPVLALAAKSSAPKQDLETVRGRAAANGYPVSDRCLVPGEVLQAYEAAR